MAKPITRTFIFGNTDDNVPEIYDSGEFESLAAAKKHADEMADQMNLDIEVYELKYTAQPEVVDPSTHPELFYQDGDE